ncbi:Spa2p NDAI_0D02980 [Naumovozyma dairenensis CBS 421]|uniref:GIT Spa2 homology (SHD) domain-containing protein n=1 Tax=Naumovozyma dairenensis (strain ATCC 10597 / BCRC 20456 / CBS 421 / NBRC 0211 / NRRL Y-12639) TaxID=1071378 RepID=G0WA01_NAUDC|nr:hypothetical protein NDAI_0D02980 [Naumovozyma dairenensis CBS 421]CCD24612.1 hypothetical protein NDAI_0D02980 [Naumovozyma dairenensis CBS 421]
MQEQSNPSSPNLSSSMTPNTATKTSNITFTKDQQNDIYQYYVSLNDFFKVTGLTRPNRSASTRAQKARAKLLKLSSSQFYELSTDVSDELQRRIDENNTTISSNGSTSKTNSFLAPRSNFHLKRNQARQKLANLSQTRFNDLVDDILFEIKRRGYHIKPVEEEEKPSKAEELQLKPPLSHAHSQSQSQSALPTTSIQSSLIIPQKASIDWSSEDDEDDAAKIGHSGDEDNATVDNNDLNETINTTSNDTVNTVENSNPFMKALENEMALNSKIDETFTNEKFNNEVQSTTNDNTTRSSIDDDASSVNKIDLSKNVLPTIITETPTITTGSTDPTPKEDNVFSKGLPVTPSAVLSPEEIEDNSNRLIELQLKIKSLTNELSLIRHENNTLKNKDHNTSKLINEQFVQKELINLNSELSKLSIENENLKQNISELELKLKSQSSRSSSNDHTQINLLNEMAIEPFTSKDGYIPIDLINTLYSHINSFDISLKQNTSGQLNMGTQLFKELSKITNLISHIISTVELPQFNDQIVVLKASLSHMITSTRYYSIFGHLLPKITMYSAISEIIFALCNLIKIAKIRPSNNNKAINHLKTSASETITKDTLSTNPLGSKEIGDINNNVTTNKTLPLSNADNISNTPLTPITPNFEKPGFNATGDITEFYEDSPVKPLKIAQKPHNSPLLNSRSNSRQPSNAGFFPIKPDSKASSSKNFNSLSSLNLSTIGTTPTPSLKTQDRSLNDSVDNLDKKDLNVSQSDVNKTPTSFLPANSSASSSSVPPIIEDEAMSTNPIVTNPTHTMDNNVKKLLSQLNDGNNSNNKNMAVPNASVIPPSKVSKAEKQDNHVDNAHKETNDNVLPIIELKQPVPDIPIRKNRGINNRLKSVPGSPVKANFSENDSSNVETVRDDSISTDAQNDLNEEHTIIENVLTEMEPNKKDEQEEVQPNQEVKHDIQPDNDQPNTSETANDISKNSEPARVPAVEAKSANKTSVVALESSAKVPIKSESQNNEPVNHDLLNEAATQKELFNEAPIKKEVPNEAPTEGESFDKTLIQKESSAKHLTEEVIGSLEQGNEPKIPHDDHTSTSPIDLHNEPIDLEGPALQPKISEQHGDNAENEDGVVHKDNIPDIIPHSSPLPKEVEDVLEKSPRQVPNKIESNTARSIDLSSLSSSSKSSVESVRSTEKEGPLVEEQIQRPQKAEETNAVAESQDEEISIEEVPQIEKEENILSVSPFKEDIHKEEKSVETSEEESEEESEGEGEEEETNDENDSYEFVPLDHKVKDENVAKIGTDFDSDTSSEEEDDDEEDAPEDEDDDEDDEEEEDDEDEDEEDFDVDAFDIENPDNTLSELLLYLEHQTVQVISTIQSLLSSIKEPEATKGDLRTESNAINQVINQMVDATSISMNQSRNANLKKHGIWVVQSLEDCGRRMTVLCQLNRDGVLIKMEKSDGDYADKHFKQRLAGIVFDVAKCTKELVKTVEEASLKEEIDYLNSRLN